MTATTTRKLVITSLMTGVIQADGFLQSLPLPLWVVQYAHAGAELAFIGSVSALAYEVGAYGWRLATMPREKTPASSTMPETVTEETQRGWVAAAKALGGRIAELDARLAKLDPASAARVADAPQSAPSTEQAVSEPAPLTTRPNGQRLQPGSTSLADVLAEVVQ